MCERLCDSIDLYFDDAMYTFVCYEEKRYQIIVANLQRHCVHLAFVSYFHFFSPPIRLYSIYWIQNKKKKNEKLHFFLQETIESLYIHVYV